MTRSLVSICLSIIFLSVLVGCKTLKERPMIEIISAREYYPLLLEEALKWQEDAYLDQIDLYFDPRDIPIRAHFLSLSCEFESLGVNVLQDGTISTEIFEHEVHIYHHPPILESDWEIDSEEALNLILKKTNHAPIDFSKVTNYLKLQRYLATQSQPVVWHLALIYDLGGKAEHYYLDPIKGEMVEFNKYNITPPFTPTP